MILTVNESPLITAVIPTFRRPSLLKRAVLSVLGQTMPRVRVEIYDNASGDETESLVKRIQQRDARLGYFCHPENVGALPNFDFGMRRVYTPFFSLLSDDDVLMPDWYSTALALFRTYPQAAFVASRVAVVDERARILSVSPSGWRDGIHRPPDAVAEMARLGHPVWTGAVFRRDIVERVGPLDVSLGMAADVEFEMRIGARQAFVTTAQVGACFQVHERSSVSSMTADEMWTAYARLSAALMQLPELHGSLGRHVAALIRANAARSLMRHGLAAIARRDWLEAKRTLTLVGQLNQYFSIWLRALFAAGRLGFSRLFKLLVGAKRRVPSTLVFARLQGQYTAWLETLTERANCYR